jgi:hypothetical protein
MAVMMGCATKAPPYQPSIDNVTVLKKSATTGASVGAFAVQAGAKGGASLSLRAAEMTPPAGTYADYLAGALKAELELAQRLNPKATIDISGLLVKNNIDAGGISTNSGEIEAQFIVRRDGAVRFDKVKRASSQWESSFAGAVAIPKAQQQYPLLVQSLLAALYADADFQAATR